MAMKNRENYLNDKVLSVAAWRKRYLKLHYEGACEEKQVKCARMMTKASEELWQGLQTSDEKGRHWGWWD
jgi:hypothetical protein